MANQTNWAIRVTEDNAAELEAWRSKQPDMQDHNSVYRLTNAVHDRQTVYLLSHIYDGSYQKWGTPSKSEARIITLEEWRTITHPHAAQQPQTISRQSLETIYNAACIDWKNKIVTDIVADKPLAKDYEISPWYVAEMFKASSAEQKAVLIAAGLKDTTEKLSPYAKITSCGDGREDYLIPFKLDMDEQYPLEILIGAGLVSDKYKRRCLIPAGNACGVVPEVLFDVEGRDWMIVFEKA